MHAPAILRLVCSGFVLAAIWLGRPSSAVACSCLIDPDTGMIWFDETDVIFKGTVVSNAEPTSIDLGNGSSWPMDRYRMRVDRYFKGVLQRDVDVLTEDRSSSCGITFERGTSYLVYANLREDGTLEVPFCAPTGPTSNADEALASLGKGIAPEGSAEESGGCSASVPHTGAGTQSSALPVGAALLLGVAMLRRGRAAASAPGV